VGFLEIVDGGMTASLCIDVGVFHLDHFEFRLCFPLTSPVLDSWQLSAHALDVAVSP
jgi:hypothetical protein